MKKILRFIYINTYGCLCLFLGIAAISLPFWKISMFTLIPQGIIAFIAFIFAYYLLETWHEKYVEYKILYERNKNIFRPDTFAIYMDTPCGRKIVKIVLKDLNKKEEYKNLLKYKTSLKN